MEQIALPTEMLLRNTEMIGQLTTMEQVWVYIWAGNATFTIRSKASGTRFTYKVRKAERKDGDIKDTFFVSLLNGPDNEGDFCYMGLIGSPAGSKRYVFEHTMVFRFTRNSTVKPEAPSAKAFVWWFNKIMNNEMSAAVEVWHEGRCGRCGRKLTVPSSIASGLGPECAGK